MLVRISIVTCIFIAFHFINRCWRYF